MRKKNILTLILLAGVAILSSCKKDGFGPLTDTRPEVPVTVANVYEYRPQPTVLTSKATGGNIVITLQIPATTGRTIKEITKVAAATNYSAVQGSTVGPSGLYTNTPIPGNGTSVTFSTTIDEYRAKTQTGTTLPAVPNSNALLGRLFYFYLTLDNGQVLIPTPVRVWVVD